MILFLDIETTYAKIKKDKGNGYNKYSMPYYPDNQLVSVGFNCDTWKDKDSISYWFFNHSQGGDGEQAVAVLEYALEKADLFVAHNAKFDLSWLLSCGFKYDGPVWDTSIAEYVMGCGLVKYPSLEDTAIKYGLPGKVKLEDNDYYNMPKEDVIRYGTQDVLLLKQIYYKQMEILNV